MRSLADMIVGVAVLTAGWQYRAALRTEHHVASIISPDHVAAAHQATGIIISQRHVASPAAAERWLETCSGQGVRDAHCAVSPARIPVPSNIPISASGQPAFGAYDCRGAAALHPVHAWCVFAFQYQSPSYPNQVVWYAGYASCRTIARADAKRFG
jgi:hypothetical protein